MTTTNWQTLIPPGMAWGTSAFGVSDNNIVGYYADPYNYRGYRFDGSSYSVFEPPWTILDYQTGGLGAWANGIDGNKVVGVWRDSSRIFHGYLFDGTNFSKLDDFGTNGTLPYGISGSNIVGYYTDSSGSNHGFLFNGTSYTTLDHPLGTNGTYARGISGNNIVGFYTDSAGQNHGFKLTTTTTPPASLSIGLYAGLTITGTVGKTYSIQSTTNLADINSWTTIANITLTQPVQLWVDTSINVGPSVRHFYRLASVP